MSVQHVISTRELTPEHTQLFSQQGVQLDALNFIEIELLRTEVPQQLPEVLVVTSKNAYRALAQANQLTAFTNKTVYCVGRSSATALAELPVKSVHCYESSNQLADALMKDGVTNVAHFCGNLTLASFKSRLTQAHIQLNQYVVYHTKKTPQKITSIPQTVLFYSPSGVESYFSVNSHPVTHAVCIGPTTLQAARHFATHTHIAPETTTQSVVQTALNLIS